MANTSSLRSAPKVAFSYGFLGGPLFAHRLKKYLEANGLMWTKDLKEADVVIAHSAGCWYLNDLKNIKLLFLVGMPLAQPGWPTSFKSNRQRTINYLRNGHILQGLETNGLNLIYALSQPRRNFHIIKKAKEFQKTSRLPAAERVVFIANQDDPWPGNLDVRKPYLDKEPWAFISIRGLHDDIWENPKRYAEIIKHYARLLAETSSR